MLKILQFSKALQKIGSKWRRTAGSPGFRFPSAGLTAQQRRGAAKPKTEAGVLWEGAERDRHDENPEAAAMLRRNRLNLHFSLLCPSGLKTDLISLCL